MRSFMCWWCKCDGCNVRIHWLTQHINVRFGVFFALVGAQKWVRRDSKFLIGGWPDSLLSELLVGISRNFCIQQDTKRTYRLYFYSDRSSKLNVEAHKWAYVTIGNEHQWQGPQVRVFGMRRNLRNAVLNVHKKKYRQQREPLVGCSSSHNRCFER